VSVSADKIQAIRERTDIVRIIGTYVALKKSGRNYVGLCPFHPEKSPSFSVSPAKGVYYCFGCHTGGDALDFVMKHQGLDFQGAARRLGEAVGVQMEPESAETRQRREAKDAADKVNRLASKFFVQALFSDEGKGARRVLQERQIPAEMARARALGFGGTHDGLFAYLEGHGVSRAEAAAAGLATEDGRWCLFAGRLVFTIFDAEGRIAGFGGRRLGDDPSQPKYINSRESALFNKRHLLYGLYDAQHAIRRSKRIVLVEGYTDVLAAHRAEVNEAVAALGTAFTPEHAALCKRLAHEAVLLLDADAAGQRASREAAQRLMAAGLKTAVASLSAGDDPDSLVRKEGPAALRQSVAAAKPAMEYFMEVTFFRPDMSVEDRAEGARALQPLLGSLSGLERDLYMNRLAEKVGLTVEQLRRHLQTRPKDAARPPHRLSRPPHAGRAAEADGSSTRHDGPASAGQDGPSPSPGAAGSARLPERPARAGRGLAQELDILRELLLFPSLRARFGEIAEYMIEPENQALMEALADTDAPLPEVLAAHVKDPNWVKRLSQIRADEAAPLDEVIAKSNRTFEDVLARLKWRHIDVALRDVLGELRAVEARGEATDTLMRRKQELTARKRALRRVDKAPRASK
jgi:DNA primase